MNPEKPERELSYEVVRTELEAFLPSVGERVLTLRWDAESDPDFVRLKADKTIVTKADELAETLIREWIVGRFPDDSIRGEEQEPKIGTGRLWIIDPIDGTYNFSNFGNKFGISVGVVENNVPKLGVIHYPAEGVALSASQGSAPLLNNRHIDISFGKEAVNEACILASTHPIHRTDERFQKRGAQLDGLLQGMHHESLGWSFTVDFLHFLQRQDVDALSHPGATPYDIGAMCSIAKELGLSVSDYEGEPIDFSKDIIPILISKNVRLHAAILERLQ